MSERSDAVEDRFLDDLALGLQPVSQFQIWHLWAGAGVGLLVACAAIIAIFGPRPEMLGLIHGVMPTHLVVMAKPLLFLVTGVAALWGMSDLVRPEGRLNWRSLALILLALFVVLVALVVQILQQNLSDLLTSLVGGDVPCAVTIFLGGMIALFLLWWLWLRNAATMHPTMLGALSGLATASLMAAAYAIHCNMDAPIYILLIYGLSVGLFVALAALLGRRFLRW